MHMKNAQRGGTIIGFIIGVLVGLGSALAVAVYVTKVPVPFLNKGSSRSAEQDAAEAQKNKNWDPNAPLYGKSPARASGPVTSDAAGTPAAPAQAPVSPPAETATQAPAVAAAASKPEAKPKQEAKAESKPESKPGDPLGDLAKAAATGAVDPFDYFVQAGAFRTQEDADAQRAKLAMLGWQARVSEREQSGRPVFRVRVGPFSKRDDAEQLKAKLAAAGVESALVRVNR